MALIVDADMLVYQFAHSEQDPTVWPNYGPHGDLYTLVGNPVSAERKILEFIEEMLKLTDQTTSLSVLSDAKDNYRKDLDLLDYKGNRSGGIRPLLYHHLRDWFLEKQGAQLEPRLEGDDLCGLMAGTSDVILTQDKDLRTVPGWHFNWVKEKEPVYVDEDEAMYNFCFQVLTGDTSDGYTGIPGVGPVKAAKILADAGIGDYWEAVCTEYSSRKLSLDFAFQTGQAAWILRGADYNFETEEINTWLMK